MAFIEASLEELPVSAKFGSELLSNKDQCTRAQLVWVVPPQIRALIRLAFLHSGSFGVVHVLWEISSVYA